MDIQSNPFIRNDYWPSYNKLNEINHRIDNVESDLALNTASLQLSINNVSDNLNAYKAEQADTSISNNIIVNDINANYAKGKYGNFQNISSDNIVTNNLQVVQPITGATLTDAAVINPHITGGIIDDVSITNVNLGQFVELNDVNVKNLNVLDTMQVDDIYSSNVNSVNVNADFGNIKNLSSDNVDIVNASIDNASIDVADIVSLDVTSAVIGNIASDNIVANNVDALNVKAEELTVNDFNAPVNAFIENLAFNTINGSGINALGVNADIISANRIVIGQSDFTDVNVENLHANNALFENITLNINEEPVQTSAILGYDVNGRIIPVGTPTYTPDLPNNADYILTDEFGIAFAGQADTVVTEGSSNLVTSDAVFNIVSDVNNNISNDISNIQNDINNGFNIINNNIHDSIANNNADATLKDYMMGNSAYSGDEHWPYNGKTPTGNLYFTSNFGLISELDDVLFNANTLTTFGVKDGDGYAIGIGNSFMAHGNDANVVDGVNNIIITKDQQFSKPFFEINASLNANSYGIPGKDVYIEEFKPGFGFNVLMAKALHTPAGTFEAASCYANYSILPSLCGRSHFLSDELLNGDITFNTDKWPPIMSIEALTTGNINVDDFQVADGRLLAKALNVNNVYAFSANILTLENASIDVNINRIDSYLNVNIGKGTSVHLDLNESPLRRVEFMAAQDAQENTDFNDHDIYINGFNCINIDSVNNSNNCYFIDSYSGQIMNNVNVYLRPTNFVDTPDIAFYSLFKNLPAGQINIHIPSTFDDSTPFYQWCNAANPVFMVYNDL